MTHLSETQPVIGELIASLAPDQLPDARDVAAARERLDWRRAGQRVRTSTGAQAFIARVSTPWRVAAGSLAAAVALALMVAFTPEGNSAAAAFLAQFRSQQVSAVEITPQSQADIMRSLDALGNLGTVQAPGRLERQPAPGPRTPGRRAKSHRFDDRSVPDDWLHPVDARPGHAATGIDKNPVIKVNPGSQIRFTFDKARAQAYYRSTGHPEVNLPDKFDGAVLTSRSRRGAAEYGPAGHPGRADRRPGRRARGRRPGQGQPARDARLPARPAGLAARRGQPARRSELEQTLPIPVPVDKVNWQSTTFNGNQGLLLNDNSGVGSAAIWHANGHLYGVAGHLKAVDLKRVADSLAVR